MQITDVEQRLSFLDTEHRRERADLDRLRSQAQSQASALDHLGQRFAELVSEVQATQARLAELETFEDSLTNLRAELVGLIEAEDQRTRVSVERLQEDHQAAALRDEDLAQRAQGLRGDLDRTTLDVADLRLDRRDLRLERLHAGVGAVERLLAPDLVPEELGRPLSFDPGVRELG